MKIQDNDDERFEDVPVLEELRVSLAEAYAQQERVELGDRRDERRRRRWSWTRRLFVLAGATAVLVPSAVATRPWWSPAPDSFDPEYPLESRRPVILGEGRGPDEAWRLSVSVRRGERCLALRVQGASDAIGCDATVPRRRDLSSSFASGGRDGFVYGATSARVVEVRVRTADGQTGTARTQDPAEDMLRRGGVPRDFRWYVAVLPEPIDPTKPLSVIAYDSEGNPVDAFRPRRR